MRIVISTAVYYPMINGVATFSHNLATGLVKRGHQVMVLCPSLTKKNHVEIQDGVRVQYLHSIEAHVYPDQIHPVPAKKKLFGKELPHLYYKDGFHISVMPSHEIEKALNKFKPDIIHSQISDPIGIATVHYAKKNNIPIITTEHNYPDVITDPLKLPKFIKKPTDAILAAYFVGRQKKSDYVTMPTQKAINELILSRDEEFKVPVEAVSNGVDLTAFKPGKAPSTFYQKFHIPEGRPTVLYVGRVDPEKQVGLVIDAFAGVLSVIPDAILVVAGDGVDRLNLERKVIELNIKDSVFFLGRVMPPELYDAYKVGDLFATASEIETQGIVLIEAAATGLPLIAVNKGAVSEVCQNDVNGFLYEPKDVVGIQDGMVKILSDKKLRENFSEQSSKIAKNHDMNNTLDRFEEIYRTVLKK